MKLLTHNMLMCAVKNCTTNKFPLKIQANSIQKQTSEFNIEFMKHMLKKIDWSALVSACNDISVSIPPEIPTNPEEDLNFLQNLHNILLDISIQEGNLICNNCGRNYPIRDGIPNMLLNEDEV
jgi:multifunctional methyltransferase subunit TRM112